MPLLCVLLNMQNISEPKVRQGSCSYCGDAPINHNLHKIENHILYITDNTIGKLVRYVPHWIEQMVDLIPGYLFRLLSYLKLAHFSNDIEKATSFRSRVIWEEAKRRDIYMEQVIIGKNPIDQYRAIINGKFEYFESLPIPPKLLGLKKNWDNKIILKKELSKHNIPVPKYMGISNLSLKNLESIFNKFEKPIIVKPEIGSRARHTITNINTVKDFKKGVVITNQISTHLVVEEHLHGYVCRATVVDGVLLGFYRGQAPFIVGDGIKTIRTLIKEKDEIRNNRIEPIRIGEELSSNLARYGFDIDDILPDQVSINLSHRIGRLFGGSTKEMIDELHPSFIPILEKAGKVVGLAIAGFDCIVPDPTKDQSMQKWGIIECNTLPFIDLHYYALEGKPRNIAGAIWDLWN